jgi:hypothetical protein
MFIQTESTPNPNSLKFLLDLDTDSQSYEFSSIEECNSSDLAKLLFQINGVEKVFFLDRILFQQIKKIMIGIS